MVLLSCIVQSLRGGCGKLIQIRLITVHEGLSQPAVSRGFWVIFSSRQILLYFFILLHISAFISLHRRYKLVTSRTWTSCLWWCSRYESILSQVYTRYGKCYTFNGNKTTSRKTKQGGMGNGLEIMLDIQQDEYLPIWRETSKPKNLFGHHKHSMVQREMPLLLLKSKTTSIDLSRSHSVNNKK